ncbi:MAG: RICIN domain-containing protein [Luteolibacter sp.]
MNRPIKTWLASLTLPFALGLPQALAYTHPGSTLNLADLQAVKAKINANQQPWQYEFSDFAQRQNSSYIAHGPFATVSRSPDVNLSPWRADMTAIWNMSLMWYFTGDNAYAQKAHDVLLAWANTQTSFSGQESMLDIGDYAPSFVGAAEILRGTWPGWTAADTTTVKAYFANVLMPGANPWGESMYGAANKGALAMMSQGLMGIFNDDTVTVDRITLQARTLAHVGLRSSNDIGMLGDSLRDQGHAQVQLSSLTILAEALWKQGIDIYSDYNNRLLAAGEYYARVNDLAFTTPWLRFGSTDAYYTADVTNHGFPAGATALSILQGAYGIRKGLPTPNITRRLQEMPPAWLFMKDADLSTAASAPALTIPATTSITSGFSDAEIGNTALSGNSSYSGGTWTVNGSGWSMWGTTSDDCHFTYQAVTGDCAIIAKVESVQNTHLDARAGVMLRTSLSAGAPRVWMAVTPRSTVQQNIQGIAVYAGNTYGNKTAAGTPGPSYWVKLERIGNIVTGSISPDGTNWAATEVGRLDNSPATWYVGLVVSSTSGVLNTSTFSNVQITGGNGGAPIVTPAAPAAFLAAAGENTVSLRWQPSFGATSYTIKRATTSGGPYSTLASGVTASSYTDAAVTNGTTYYYVVDAINSAGTSADSPADSATPIIPMVNLAFGGTATSSMVGGPSWEQPYFAFIRDSGWKWTNANASNPGPTGWLRYDFGAGNEQTVKRYTVVSSDVAAGDPKIWTFQGSNDGLTWTTLDTQINQSFVNRFHANTYKLGTPAAYRYYQINITASNGTTLAIAELGLWSDTGRTIPDGTYRVISKNSKKVLDLYNGGTADGTDAVQWGWSGGNSQKWTVTYLGNGQYQALGVASGKPLEVTGASTSNGAVVQIWPSLNTPCQKWTVTPASDGNYKFLNVNSGKALDVSGASTADGAAIIQWPYSGADNQQWRISIAP